MLPDDASHRAPTVATLRRYLAQHLWAHVETRADGIDVYQHRELRDDEGAALCVLAPGRDGMRDEPLLRGNLVRALATLEGRPVDAVLTEMGADRADAA